VSTDPRPIFLFGAGFNADAKCESGAINGVAYPLASDLARICFPSLAEVRSIEDLFNDAQKNGNREPIRRLADCLMAADYDLVDQLLPGSKRNCYSRFFEHFAGSQYLTFNYDSLPELFLFHQNLWYPHDGYGVPVDCEIYPSDAHLKDRCSTSLVLHLHGSLYLYASPYTLEEAPGEKLTLLKEREQPQFRFDPDKIGQLFPPYQRLLPNHDWDLPESRVIAPVPDKTEGLKGEFITKVYERADELLRYSTIPLVAIGYSFNPHDRASYHPLLTSLQSGSSSVLLISPDAMRMQRRLSLEFPRVEFEPLEHTLKSWVEAEFPGLQ
jgi:hypothetical protein